MRSISTSLRAGRSGFDEPRRAVSPIHALDGVDRKLEPGMLVIADRIRAQAVAGVIGRQRPPRSPRPRAPSSSEGAFHQAGVRSPHEQPTCWLKTEASARIQKRGADVSAPVAGLQRAIALMERIGAGKVSGPLVDRLSLVTEPSPPAC